MLSGLEGQFMIGVVVPFLCGADNCFVIFAISEAVWKFRIKVRKGQWWKVGVYA
jgi:hypothetical protein